MAINISDMKTLHPILPLLPCFILLTCFLDSFVSYAQVSVIQSGPEANALISTSSSDLLYHLSASQILYGEVSSQQNTPDGRVAQLLGNIPYAQGGTKPAIAMYNPSTQSLDWVLQIDVIVPTDLQVVEEANGSYSIWVSSMSGDLVKVDPEGNLLESYHLGDPGGNRNTSSTGTGFTFSIMAIVWNANFANTLYLAVRTFNIAQDGYGMMLLALDITSGVLIQYQLAFTLSGSGYVPYQSGYEIKGFLSDASGNLWLIAYDHGSNRMAYLRFSPALALLAAYSSPFFYLNFNAFAIVNNYLLMAGTSLITGCNNCALLGYMDFLNNPGIIFLSTFLNPAGFPANKVREFTGLVTDCPESERNAGTNCPIILSGQEYDFYNGTVYDPFLVFIPDFTNITSAEKKLVKNDTGLCNGVSKTRSGVIMTYGSSGRFYIDESPWLNLSKQGESNSCQSSETMNSSSQSWTLDNLSIDEDTSVHSAFTIDTLIKMVLNMFVSSSCPRNCDLTADMLFLGGPCPGSNIDFISTSYGNPGPAYYAWKFSDGTIIQGIDKAAISRTFTDTGRYIVTLIVSDDFACTDSISDTFYICSGPNAHISSGDPNYCIKWDEADSLTFLDVSDSNGCGQIVSRIWKRNGDTVATGKRYIGEFWSYDTAKITLIVTTDQGCVDSASLIIEYGEGPEIDGVDTSITNRTACKDLTIRFEALVSEGSSPVTEYRWKFKSKEGNTKSINQTAKQTSITFDESDSWTYTITVVDSNGCVDSLVDSFNISIANPPIAQFISTAPVCFDRITSTGTIDFTDQSLAGDAPIVKWEWDFGDGSPVSNKQNPTHDFTAAGTYNVQLIVTDRSGCQDQITKKIRILRGPDAKIGVPGYWCLGLPLHFKDKSVPGDAPINAWKWTFGDGGNSNLQNPVHTYTSTGAGLIITLKVTDANGCSDQADDLLDIITVLASIAGDSTGCEGESLNFQATALPAGKNYRWKWEFGDGSTDTVQNTSHAFQNKGSYTLQLTAIEPGGICADTATKSVMIYGNPDAYFAADTFCALLDSVLFRDSSYADPGNPINAWTWFFRDDTLYGREVYYSPNDSAEGQWVTLTVNTLQNCSDSYSDSLYFVVDSLLNTGFSAVINKMSVTFTDTSQNAIRHDWDFGDGSSAEDSSRSIDHQYAAAGTYKVRLITYSYCDRDTLYRDVTIVPSGILSGPQGNYEIVIQPNPNNGHFHLLLKSKKPGTADISIYDLNGRLVYSKKEKISKSGEAWDFDLSGESKGLYILKIAGPQGHSSRLVIYQ